MEIGSASFRGGQRRGEQGVHERAAAEAREANERRTKDEGRTRQWLERREKRSSRGRKGENKSGGRRERKKEGKKRTDAYPGVAGPGIGRLSSLPGGGDDREIPWIRPHGQENVRVDRGVG